MNPVQNEHLSPETLSALVDGELTGNDLARASEHLAACRDCTSRALQESLLQRATARAGQRYDLPEGFEQRMLHTIAAQPSRPAPARSGHSAPSRMAAFGRLSLLPASIAALLLVSVSGFVAHDFTLRNAHSSALVAETVDEHIAAMAATAPQVISTDRHTVKPWFQGKLPFSFNLPNVLPPDTTLDGGNLVQLDGAPTAQLVFSIGKHHASVFLRQRGAASSTGLFDHTAERNGFHVEGFHAQELDGIAVSDADPSRLHLLALAMEQAQSNP